MSPPTLPVTNDFRVDRFGSQYGIVRRTGKFANLLVICPGSPQYFGSASQAAKAMRSLQAEVDASKAAGGSPIP